MTPIPSRLRARWTAEGWDRACPYFGGCRGLCSTSARWKTPTRPLPNGVSASERTLRGCPGRLVTNRERSAYSLLRASQQYGHALPSPGGLLNQSAWLVSAHRALADELVVVRRGAEEQAERAARMKAAARKAQGG